MTAIERLIKGYESTKELEDLIKVAATEYYSGEATLTDVTFDKLVEELKIRNPESEVLHKTGWGYDISSSNRRKSSHWDSLLVGSLSKVHKVSEISLHSSDIILTPKLDGLSVVCYYEDGKFKQAITRGNGRVGIDVTSKIQKIIDEASKETTIEKLAIRGEIVMSNDSWEEYKITHPEAKNSRNAASGIINRIEDSEDIKYLTVVFYNILYSSQEFSKQSDIIEYIQKYFPKNAIPYIREKEGFTDEDLLKYYNKWSEAFPCDGVVVTDNNLENSGLNRVIGISQVAYKFEAESKDCTVTDIEWNMTRTGNYIPVIRIETVELSGTNVSRVTGFNAKFIQNNRIGKGAVINVMKSGEIIPDVQYVVKESPELSLPTMCPACDSPLIFDGVNLKCSNPECASKKYNDFKAFVCTLGSTENIGWNIMEKFFDELRIYSIDDLFSCEYAPIEEYERSQRKLFNKVLKKLYIDPIDSSDLLCALNIPSLGRASANKLAPNKEAIEACIEAYNTKSDDKLERELSKVLTPSVTRSIIAHKDKIAIIEKLWNRLVFKEMNNITEMIQVAITGKLSMKRDDFIRILNDRGYKVGGVNKDCKFLITDNPLGSSSKNKLADKLGVTKISEKDFTEKYLG